MGHDEHHLDTLRALGLQVRHVDVPGAVYLDREGSWVLADTALPPEEITSRALELWFGLSA